MVHSDVCISVILFNTFLSQTHSNTVLYNSAFGFTWQPIVNINIEPEK